MAETYEDAAGAAAIASALDGMTCDDAAGTPGGSVGDPPGGSPGGSAGTPGGSAGTPGGSAGLDPHGRSVKHPPEGVTIYECADWVAMIAGVSDIVGAVGVPSLVIASGDAEKRAALSALYHRIRWDERWGWIARSDSYWGIALLLGAAFGPSLRGAGRDLLELREKIKKSADLANAPAQVKGDVALVKSDPSALANEPDFCTVSG